MRKFKNVPFVFFGFLILFFAVLGGINRLGLSVMPIDRNWNVMHGPLMVAGFLGIVISLERAVALGKFWGFLSPVFSTIGGLGLAFGFFSLQVATVFFSSGSIILVLMFLAFLKKHPDENLFFMAVGALFFLTGNISLAVGNPVFESVNYWVSFLIFTIVAERLELSSFLFRTKFQINLLRVILALVGIFSFVFEGSVLFGLSVLGVSAWLIFYDIARKTIRKSGLARYSAFCLLTGYFWLGFFGVLLMISNGLKPGFYYDSCIHSFFLGFIFLLIFGHAPIIFPSIMGANSVYSPFFYIHFIILNLSLVARIYGSLAQNPEMRALGGIGNSVSLGLFLFLTMPLVLAQVIKKK